MGKSIKTGCVIEAMKEAKELTQIMRTCTVWGLEVTGQASKSLYPRAQNGRPHRKRAGTRTKIYQGMKLSGGWDGKFNAKPHCQDVGHACFCGTSA